ncbi:outer membrane receptor protein involved in Fe transport [Povalibacter uvarum]|uniref:Outer membrane receptor protein involved in Fe transport n=1 Tax=Povalibacter uvarum TaxID=732238 RepID=A0A841HV33_9GAMM|nr:TonB-dependent receptor [Povalibacter uvarum]MBB6095808.1 outer membrane receptor protein involved in Fe transport [Povalibacter uvarum]
MSDLNRVARRDLVTAISLVLLGSAAGAQNAQPEAAEAGSLEEVVVTAQKREESLSDVPIAITAISADKLQDAGIVSLEGMKNYAPSFLMQPTPQGNAISIRGIFSGTNAGFEQSVGTYVDGLYRGRGQQARTPFLDLERIEVLRGSQSILFGKNSVAGALNITSARPTGSFEGSVSALYEPEYDEQLYTGVLSGPLGTDRLRGRVAARYREYGGNIENLTKLVDESEQEESQVRAWLEFDLTDNVELALKAEHSKFDSTGRPYEVVDDRAALPSATRPVTATYAQTLRALGADASVLNNFPDGKRSADAAEFSDNEMNEYGFFVDWQLGEHTLTAITGYSEYEFGESTDADITGAPVLVQSVDEEFEQVSQELRLTSPTGGRIEYLAGVYWEKTELDSLTKIPFYSNTLLIPILTAQVGATAASQLSDTDGPRTFSQESESYAGFVHVTWNITDALRSNVGLRYTKEDKTASRAVRYTDLNGAPLDSTTVIAGLPPSFYTLGIDTRAEVVAFLNRSLLQKVAHNISDERSEDHVLPSVGLQYDITDDVMTYATWTKGAKGGGYDSISNAPPGQGGSFEFEPEKAENYEIGAKMTFAGQLEVNLAAYYTEFDDLQVSVFNGVSYNVSNAGAAEIKGVELDSRWRATSNLLFSAAVAWTDFEFTEFSGAPCPIEPSTATAPAGVTCDNAGKPNQYVADWTASASADYRIPMGSRFELRTVLDAYYTGDYFASPNLDPKQTQEAYTKLNGRISFGRADSAWDIALVGKNLTDERIMPYGADLPLANSLTRGGFAAMRYIEPGRSVAVQANFRF